MSPDHTLAALRANPQNPRTITPEKALALKKALLQFGDLGGVVLNRRTGHLVTGHQRSDVLRDQARAEIVVQTRYERPSKTGTVAEGYVVLDGERYAYREVDWDEPRAKAAAVAANQNAGSWDMTGLTAWLNELHDSSFDMDLTMFSAEELRPFLPDDKDLSLEFGAEDAPGPVDQGQQSHADNAVTAQTSSLPPSHIKQVQLFYSPMDHIRLTEAADALREVWEKENLSETILEAVQRAAISAAVN